MEGYSRDSHWMPREVLLPWMGSRQSA
jgi:hypothetical protein